MHGHRLTKLAVVQQYVDSPVFLAYDMDLNCIIVFILDFCQLKKP